MTNNNFGYACAISDKEIKGFTDQAHHFDYDECLDYIMKGIFDKLKKDEFIGDGFYAYIWQLNEEGEEITPPVFYAKVNRPKD